MAIHVFIRETWGNVLVESPLVIVRDRFSEQDIAERTKAMFRVYNFDDGRLLSIIKDHFGAIRIRLQEPFCDWIAANILGDVHFYHAFDVYFEREEDAALFKLRFG